MRVRSSNNNVKGLVCLDPLRNIYRLRWDFSKDSYEEVELKYKPSKEDIQSIIEDYYNKQIEENNKKIKSKMGGKALPVTFSRNLGRFNNFRWLFLYTLHG